MATAALTGNRLGCAVLWAVVVGAVIKLILNEGLARWQLATGDTLLEGCFKHFGMPAKLFFLAYFLLWSFAVGGALMSACGVTAHALIPIFDDAVKAKIVFGLLHSLLGVVLVELGGFRVFEKVMSACIALMFVTVTVTAVMVRPNLGKIAEGLFLFQIPDWGGDGVSWTVALMGGVGGTLTVLCYGYWIREAGRTGPGDLSTCRLDLTAAYLMTAIFGIAMVVIGSTIVVEGSGAGLVVSLGERLGTTLGPAARWIFLLGAWGAVFSSLLGVWQSVPYLFADFCRMAVRSNVDIIEQAINVKGRPYRMYLYALAVAPTPTLWYQFTAIQKGNAIFGAAFMPILALALLLLNGHAKWIGIRLRNGWVTNVVLLLIIAFFIAAGWLELTKGP